MQYLSETQIDNITSETCKQLAKEKKITVTIKPESGEAFWEGGINGHFFRIRTDTPVRVPESLARQIALSNQVRQFTEKAVKDFRKGGGKKVS